MNEDTRKAFAEAMLSGAPVANLVTKAQGRSQLSPSKDAFLIPELNVGIGRQYGNLTWFPVWTNGNAADRGYVTNFAPNQVKVAEQANATVGSLFIENNSPEPVLLVEGTLLEGGMQHRALTRSVLVNANSTLDLPVVCVEQGRWNGTGIHQVAGKSVPTRVRAAMRGMKKEQGSAYQGDADQNKVWSEINNVANEHGVSNLTNSWVDMNDHIGSRLQQERVEPLPGQTGVIVGINGKPIALELFDHPDTLQEKLQGILDNLQIDAYGQKYVATTGHEARKFAREISKSELNISESAMNFRNSENPKVASAALVIKERIMHLTTLNPEHELVLAA